MLPPWLPPSRAMIDIEHYVFIPEMKFLIIVHSFYSATLLKDPAALYKIM